jgi:hypothetical protein
VCGRCGAPLIAQHRRGRKGDRQPAYLCHRSRGGCNGIGIGAVDLERHVAAVLLDELDKPAMRDALAEDEHDVERARLVDALAAVDVQRGDLAGMWARRELTQAEWSAARAALDAEQARLSAELADLPPPAVDIDPAMIRAGWDAMTLDERRQVVDLFVAAVVVSPALPGTRKFDPGRVAIDWRTL